MSAVTYSVKSFGSRVPTVRAADKPRGVFSRLLSAIIAARSEQAEREVERYLRSTGRDPQV